MNSTNPRDMEQARCLVRAVFEEMGVDMSTPGARIEAQQDFAFLRSWRDATAGTRRFALRATVVTLVTGVLGLLWVGFVNLR